MEGAMKPTDPDEQILAAWALLLIVAVGALIAIFV
jgi:hypothetical protein